MLLLCANITVRPLRLSVIFVLKQYAGNVCACNDHSPSEHKYWVSLPPCGVCVIRYTVMQILAASPSCPESGLMI